MVSQKVKIKNPTGLHLRPAGILCKEAMQYKSLVTFHYRGNTANAKSVLSVLGACIKFGDEIEFVCEGDDEDEALKVVEDFKRVIPEAVIYVYDNNSNDGTDELARSAGAVVRYEYQQGKGNVIRRMFREIDAECYIMTDGDDTYPAESAPEMIKQVLEHGADMVVGDRLSSTYFQENTRPFHNFGNSLVRKSINLFFHTDIKDIMTGYRAFSYQFVKSFPVLSKGFEIETEMSIHAADKNMQVDNVIIEYRDRPEGSVSKLNTYSDGFKVLRTIARLYRTYKPMSFFGIIAFILAALGVGFLIPVLVVYAKTGMVPNFPTLFACCFTILAATQAFFSGLILQTIGQKNRQDFEMELQAIEERKKRLDKE